MAFWSHKADEGSELALRLKSRAYGATAGCQQIHFRLVLRRIKYRSRGKDYYVHRDTQLAFTCTAIRLYRFLV